MELAQHAAQATAATEQRDFAQAEEEWKKVLALDPGSAQAYNNLGMVYYLEHKYPEAEATLEKALRLDRAQANARVLLGASLGRQGKLERAVAELKRALKSRLSESAEKTALLALHEALFAQGNYSQALVVLKPLAEKYPEDVDVLYNLGQTYMQLATQSFQSIEQVGPQSHRVHQILAESLAKQGHYRDAIREFRLALEQKPDLAGAHYSIGWLYWTNELNSAGEKAALQEFEAELKINPYDAASEYRLGKIYWKWRDLEKACMHLGRSVDLDEKLVPPRLALARAFESQGKLEEARKQLEVTLELEPGNAAVHYRLAQFYKRLGDQTAAAKELQKFEEIKTQRRGAESELYKTLRRGAELETEILEE